MPRAHSSKRRSSKSTKPKLLQILEHPIYHDHERKLAFHKEGKRLLRQVAKILPGNDYDLRSNLAGPAVSGEIILHGSSVYIQLSDGVFGRNEVLYRRCTGKNDYVGEQNHFASAESLCEPTAFARHITQELGLAQH